MIKIVVKGILYVLAVLAFLCGLAAFFSKDLATTGIFVCMAILLWPGTHAFLLRRFGWRVNPALNAIIILCLFVASVMAMSNHQQKAAQQEKVAIFDAQRDRWLSEMNDAQDKGDLILIVKVTEDYQSIADPEFLSAREKVLEKLELIRVKEAKAEFLKDRPRILDEMRRLMKEKSYLQAIQLYGQFAAAEDAEFNRLGRQSQSAYDDMIRQRNAERDQAEQIAKDRANKNRIEAKRLKQTRGQEGAAIAFCQDKVRTTLKAPATAKFPWNVGVNVTPDRRFFTVVSYVDAQNAFGAMLRTTYRCRLEFNGGDATGWVVNDFALVE